MRDFQGSTWGVVLVKPLGTSGVYTSPMREAVLLRGNSGPSQHETRKRNSVRSKRRHRERPGVEGVYAVNETYGARLTSLVTCTPSSITEPPTGKRDRQRKHNSRLVRVFRRVGV